MRGTEKENLGSNIKHLKILDPETRTDPFPILLACPELTPAVRLGPDAGSKICP